MLEGLMRHKVLIGIAVAGVAVIGIFSAGVRAFNPQPDPPGFGLVTLVSGQGIRVNVVCSEHGVRQVPPDPCHGDLMIHDMLGNLLTTQRVALRPGQAASLAFEIPREVGGPVGIDPCWVPNSFNQGHAIPSAEVFDTETGRTMLFLNPAVARLSQLAVAMSEAPVATDVR
jgi:hypothetical protein